MATSGTYNFNPVLGSLFLSAFSRIQVKRTELTPQHMEDAKNEESSDTSSSGVGGAEERWSGWRSGLGACDEGKRKPCEGNEGWQGYSTELKWQGYSTVLNCTVNKMGHQDSKELTSCHLS